MKISNYLVTHLATGEVSTHAGISPQNLTDGIITAEAIAASQFIPPMEWAPHPLDFSVVEATDPTTLI